MPNQRKVGVSRMRARRVAEAVHEELAADPALTDLPLTQLVARVEAALADDLLPEMREMIIYDVMRRLVKDVLATGNDA